MLDCKLPQGVLRCGGGAGRRCAGRRGAPCAPPHHLEVRGGEWRVCGGRRARQTTARAALMRSDF